MSRDIPSRQDGGRVLRYWQLRLALLNDAGTESPNHQRHLSGEKHMDRKFFGLLGMGLGVAALSGCAPTTYQPPGSDMEHVAYAAKAGYPYDTKSEKAMDVYCRVMPDATIILDNASDTPYTEFEVWVNKSYTLHVAKLDAKSEISLNPKDLYNRSAGNLVNAPASSINSVQLFVGSTGKLLDVAGPILPH